MRLTAFEVRPDHGFELRPAARHRPWMRTAPNRHPERCLPMMVANAWGWEVLAPATLVVRWNGSQQARGCLELEWCGDGPPGVEDEIRDHFGYGILTFQLPWLFRTPAGWGLWVCGPVNAWQPHAFGLSGLVETDWNPATFTMNWKLTEPYRDVLFARGEPIAHLFPVELATFAPGVWDAEVVAMPDETRDPYDAWLASRSEFNRQTIAGEIPPTEWQRDYVKGARRTRPHVPTPIRRTDDGNRDDV